jgi:hypothetical protein
MIVLIQHSCLTFYHHKHKSLLGGERSAINHDSHYVQNIHSHLTTFDKPSVGCLGERDAIYLFFENSVQPILAACTESATLRNGSTAANRASRSKFPEYMSLLSFILQIVAHNICSFCKVGHTKLHSKTSRPPLCHCLGDKCAPITSV